MSADSESSEKQWSEKQRFDDPVIYYLVVSEHCTWDGSICVDCYHIRPEQRVMIQRFISQVEPIIGHEHIDVNMRIAEYNSSIVAALSEFKLTGGDQTFNFHEFSDEEYEQIKVVLHCRDCGDMTQFYDDPKDRRHKNHRRMVCPHQENH